MPNDDYGGERAGERAVTVPLTYGPSSHEAAGIQASALHPGGFGSFGIDRSLPRLPRDIRVSLLPPLPGVEVQPSARTGDRRQRETGRRPGGS